MESYLMKVSNQLAEISGFQSVHIVCGNESCDLDSTVSTLVSSFLHQIRVSQESVNCLVIPLLNITRTDLELRKDLLFWLEDVIQINHKLFICKDDFDYKHLKNKKVFVTLVDHNENKEMSEIGQIVEIIDHHKPSNWLNNYQIDWSKVIIDVKVGSCCTLIGEQFLSNSIRNDTQIALMLYGVIILDTVCFSKSSQRYSERDISVAERLESVLGTDSSSRSEVYQQLIKAKNSIDNLSFEQLLRRDMKIVETSNNIKICVSSLSGTLASKLNLNRKVEDLKQFSTNYQFNAIIILGIENDMPDMVRRDLAIFTSNLSLLRSISFLLESETQLELKLLIDGECVRIYHQNNEKISRKIILPLLSSFFDKFHHNTGNEELNSDQTENANESKILRSQISTADVDPDFVINYKPETVDFLASPEYSSTKIETESKTTALKGSSNTKQRETNNAPELDISNFDITKVNNPESVYGSYIEDSFVGDLVGDYNNSLYSYKNESESLTHNWALNNGMNSEIEFDFDSFGPESIIYTGNNENIDHSPKENVNENAFSDKTNSKECSEQIDTDLTNNNNDKETKITPEIKNDSDNGTFSENEDNIDISYFKRNASLTQSQRKKISPRLNFQQILNSDDITPSNINDSDLTSHPLSDANLELSKNKNDNEAQQISNELKVNDDEDISRGLTRRPSTTKKKIPVNREFFTNDDLIDKIETEVNPNQISELSAQTELEESRAFKLSCPIGPNGEIKTIDMKVIEPYKKVISHGGYFQSNAPNAANSTLFQSGASPAIIVFSTFYLPYRSRKDYDYVMDNLFMYVLTTLHNLIADDYILIYFNNAESGNTGNNMPTFGFLKRCYYMMDRKLKKNLKGLYLVHPTFWLKTLIIMSKPFISSKFSKKLKFVNTLSELSDLIPIEHVDIPESVKKFDFDRMIKEKKRKQRK